MIGVMLIIVMMMIEVKISKHIVEIERQLRRLLLFRFTVQSFFIFFFVKYVYNIVLWGESIRLNLISYTIHPK